MKPPEAHRSSDGNADQPDGHITTDNDYVSPTSLHSASCPPVDRQSTANKRLSVGRRRPWSVAGSDLIGRHVTSAGTCNLTVGIMTDSGTLTHSHTEDVSNTDENRTLSDVMIVDKTGKIRDTTLSNETTSTSYTASPHNDYATTTKTTTTTTSSSSSSGGGGGLDVFNVESTLPEMNWDLLEMQLRNAVRLDGRAEKQCRNDRDVIRRRLATGADGEFCYCVCGESGGRQRRRRRCSSSSGFSVDLEVCLVGESPSTSGSERLSWPISGPSASSNTNSHTDISIAEAISLCRPAELDSTATDVDNCHESNSDDSDFFSRQARLQAEAKLALAQARPMAHMQLQLEKQLRRRSPIADIVGIPGFGDGRLRRLSRHVIMSMTLPQLQIVVNDMLAQIESYNGELMRSLQERDELHMAQDSMLVDIDDLIRRAHECQRNTQPANDTDIQLDQLNA